MVTYIEQSTALVCVLREAGLPMRGNGVTVTPTASQHATNQNTAGGAPDYLLGFPGGEAAETPRRRADRGAARECVDTAGGFAPTGSRTEHNRTGIAEVAPRPLLGRLLSNSTMAKPADNSQI